MGSKPGNLEHPHYIAVSSSNRVIVSDSNNHRIQIFDVNGKVLTTFGSEGTDAGQFKFPRYVKCKFAIYIVIIFNLFYALWYFKLLTKFCCILQRSIRRRKRLHFCSRFRKQSHPNFQPRWNIPQMFWTMGTSKYFGPCIAQWAALKTLKNQAIFEEIYYREQPILLLLNYNHIVQKNITLRQKAKIFLIFPIDHCLFYGNNFKINSWNNLCKSKTKVL